MRAEGKCRYKDPDSKASRLLIHPVLDQAQTVPSQDFRLAVPVAMFGMLLRESSAKGRASYQVAYDLPRIPWAAIPGGSVPNI